MLIKKFKIWLIHKLGGNTRKELNICYPYKTYEILTLNSMAVIPISYPEEYVKKELAIQLMKYIEENMQIECNNTPEEGMIKYRGILKVVKTI